MDDALLGQYSLDAGGVTFDEEQVYEMCEVLLYSHTLFVYYACEVVGKGIAGDADQSIGACIHEFACYTVVSTDDQ